MPVVRGQREITVRFAALGQGSPQPGVNPAEITSISWALPRPALDGDGSAVSYQVDLRIDDRFVN